MVKLCNFFLKTKIFPYFLGFSFACATLAISHDSFAWGENGHRIVGEIASHRLHRKARHKLEDILGSESLARASTWSDEVRSDQKYSKHTPPWHFVEVADGKTYESVTHPAEGDSYTALLNMEAILADKNATRDQQREAVRFIVHLVGDIHQPLHVGNGTDRGANWCTVTYMSKATNLHALWDTDLIDAIKLSFTEYTRFLEDSLTKENEKLWSSGNYLDWIAESQNLRDALYPKVIVNGAEVAGRPYCKDPKQGVVDPTLIPKLSYDYAYQNRPILDQRLTQAGVRLAYVLNEIFEGKRKPSSTNSAAQASKKEATATSNIVAPVETPKAK